MKSAKPDAVFAIGECMNGDPFELALALVKYGFQVAEIYGDNRPAENFVYLKHLSELSPQTKVFSNMEPTMMYYDQEESGVTITIGKDACYYHPDAKNVMWNEEVQPYGYAGVKPFLRRNVGGVGDEGIKKIYDTIFNGPVWSGVGVIRTGGMLVVCEAAAVREMYVDSMSQDGLKQEVRYSVRGFVIWMRYSEETTDWLQNLQMRQKSWM